MSLLPRKEKKNQPSWKMWGYTDVPLHVCFLLFLFLFTCRQLVIRVKLVMLTFASDLQRLTTCCSLIRTTHPLMVERPTLQNTVQLS